MGNNYFAAIENAYLRAVSGMHVEWFENASPAWYNYVLSLSEELQIAYLVSVFSSQAFNGGIHQYFYNGYGQFAKETITCLQKINASEPALILSKAYRKLRSECSTDEDFRVKILKRELLGFSESEFKFFEELDSEYEPYFGKIDHLLGVYLYNKE